MAEYSLNEIHAQCRKAVRGAGYSWGLSEDAGRAARWLSASGFDGPGALLRLLIQTDGMDLHSATPPTDISAWKTCPHPVCSLIAGTTILDRADILTPEPFLTPVLMAPTLFLPFLGMTAAALDCGFHVDWSGGTTEVFELGCVAQGDLPKENIALTVSRISSQVMPYPTAARDISDDLWNAVGAFAHRTYAPATEESRLAGAGAGLTDND